MIIDKILDRKDGQKYIPKQFYNDVMQYGEIGHGIAEAMDGGTEKQVKTELGIYIIKNGYNLNIIDYINTVDWL